MSLIEVANLRRLCYILAKMSTLLKYLKFGTYLLQKELITELDIINARTLQIKNNRMIGELAKGRGWLIDDDITRILVMQEDSYEKFGQIAIKENYLTYEQVSELLKEQEDSYIYFGEALVKLGAINESQLIEELKEFNRLKLEGLH
ncbi:MAG: hypothetical protein AB1442_02585 [Nitrospirota bacterium]